MHRPRHELPWRRRAMLAGAMALAAAAILATPDTAEACGGFFCSFANPVEQAGEEILFAVDGTEVTAHISIQYQGAAEDFSWVLPLPTVPQFGVGSEGVFAALRAQTDPRFEIDWDESTGCQYQNQCDCLADDLDGTPSPSPNQGGGVDVLASGNVGPFEYKVVESDTTIALYDWLNQNGYDQPPTARPILDRYVGMGFVFVALRLQKDREVGEIQPIVLHYVSDTMACVPLRLTSIAALSDMPITAWIVGEARAVPMNFFHVTLNPAAYDWLNCATPSDSGGWWGCGFGGGRAECQQSYLDLVTAATGIVNGHGFVTEYAGATSIMDEQVYRAGQYDLSRLATQTDPELFLSEMLAQGFPRTSLVQELIRTYIPMPDPATLPDDCDEETEFYTWNLQQCLQHMPPGWTFEPALFAADLDNRVIQPLVDAQALFDDHGYMTRLFTTQSPDEMNRDPIFSFNPQLPDVSNVHVIEGRATCKPGSSWDVDHVELTFPDGTTRVMTGQFQSCGGYTADAASTVEGQPALATIQVMGESGPPLIIDPSEVDLWDAQLDARLPNPNQSMLPQVEVPLDDETTGTFGQGPQSSTPVPRLGGGGGDGGCQVAPRSGTRLPAALGVGLLLGLVGLLRSSRRSHARRPRD